MVMTLGVLLIARGILGRMAAGNRLLPSMRSIRLFIPQRFRGEPLDEAIESQTRWNGDSPTQTPATDLHQNER
jgi:hypothetical protein